MTQKASRPSPPFLPFFVRSLSSPCLCERPLRRAFVLAALLATLPGCEWGGLFSKPAAAPVEVKKPERRFAVRVETAAVTSLKYEVSALGVVEAQDVYQIHSLVAGTLYDVNFHEGDKVAKADTICKIAPEAYRFVAQRQEGIYKNAAAALDDIKRKMTNEIERSKVKLAAAQLEIDRRKDIKDAGGISVEEIQLYESRRNLANIDLKDMKEAAETEMRVLEATVLEKDASWKIALDDVRKSIVKPPIDGVIEKRSVTSGMFVTPGTLLATIVDRSSLKLKFKLAEKDSGSVKPGMKVHFAVPAWPGKEFEAEVYFVSNRLDVETRSIECFARITTQAELLKPNYFASAKMVTGSRDQAVVISSTAILPTEKGFVAFVVKDGKAQQRFVKTGLSVTDSQVEILSGIEKDEQVVIEGANALQQGSLLRVLKPSEPEAPKKEVSETVSPDKTGTALKGVSQ